MSLTLHALLDLCVSAALDAVKERVTVPWRQPAAVPASPAAEPTSAEGVPSDRQTSEVPQPSTAEAAGGAPSPAQEHPVSQAAEVEEDASSSGAQDEAQAPTAEEAAPAHVRFLAPRNFDQALKEITPSASESLGSLAELRKWNDEFGEGRRMKKRQVWGKDRFGFTVPSATEASPGVVATPEQQPAANNSS